MAFHHSNYLTNERFPLAGFMLVTPVRHERNFMQTNHLPLTKETIEGLLGEFAPAIALGKYLSL